MRDPAVVPNNMGVDGRGLELLLEAQQARRVVASYRGQNRLARLEGLEPPTF